MTDHEHPHPEPGPETQPPSHVAAMADFVAALGEVTDITKDKAAKVEMNAGGSYSYTYADLADVNQMLRPVLARHNLAVTQQVTGSRSQVEVTTILLHSSGWTMPFGPITMPGGNTPQQMGSAITYARRYSILAAFNIATEDDDGRAAAQAPPQQASAEGGRSSGRSSGSQGGSSNRRTSSSGGSGGRRARADAEPPPADPAPTPEADMIGPESLVGLLEVFNGIRDDHDRLLTKRQFVEEFGQPHLLPSDQLVRAVEWIEQRVQALAPTEGDEASSAPDEASSASEEVPL